MSQNQQKLARKSSLTSLRNQRSPCKCQWCTKPAELSGKLKTRGFAITPRRHDESVHGKPLSVKPRVRLPLIGKPNLSGSEGASKQSTSTDSDSHEPHDPRTYDNSQIEERVVRRAASSETYNLKYSSILRGSLSCPSSGSEAAVVVEDCHEYVSRNVFDGKLSQAEEVIYSDDDGTLADCEDGSANENRDDCSDSESSLAVQKPDSDGDCNDSDDQELSEIFFGNVSAQALELCQSRGSQHINFEEDGCLSSCASNGSLAESGSSHCSANPGLPDRMQSPPHRTSARRSGSNTSNTETVEQEDLTVDQDALSDPEMPSEKESKMNLSALKQVDPEINEIVDSAAQVALYQYSTQTGQWAKTEVEGALYVYAHRNAHQRGLIILNRNSPKNYKEPIRADIEFKIKTPFLIYKTTAGHIFGAWFYVEEECTRVGNLCCRLVSYLKKRGRNEGGSQPDNSNQQQGISILQNLLPPSALPKVDAQSGANIMSLLKKAEGGSAQVSNGHSNGSNGGSNHHHHQNGNITQHHQNGKPKKQPLTPNNSNHNDSGRQQENGHHRKATGESTPGVPVVHKPVPTKSLPSSVEQLFKSAANPQHQQQKKQQQHHQQGSSSSSTSVAAAATAASAKQHYSPMPESTTPKTPRGAQNGGGGGDLERLLGDLSRSSLESPPPSVALVETKVEALTPLNPCMASILSKLNESAQKVQREAEMARNSPTTEEALLRAFKGPLPNNIGLEKKLTLITPEMLEESLSQGPSTPPQTMSRYELKSALLHLLDTDDDFLTKIHNAYVQGVSRRKL